MLLWRYMTAVGVCRGFRTQLVCWKSLGNNVSFDLKMECAVSPERRHPTIIIVGDDSAAVDYHHHHFYRHIFQTLHLCLLTVAIETGIECDQVVCRPTHRRIRQRKNPSAAGVRVLGLALFLLPVSYHVLHSLFLQLRQITLTLPRCEASALACVLTRTCVFGGALLHWRLLPKRM